VLGSGPGPPHPLPENGVRLVAVLIALIASGFVPSAIPAAQESEARHHLRKGRALVESGDTAAALEALQRAVNLDPNLADAHYEIGRLYERRARSLDTDYSDRKKAQRALLKAWSLDPDNPQYLLAIGRLWGGRRILERALSRAREQGLEDPEFLADLHYHLGVAARRGSDPVITRRLVPPLTSTAVRYPDESALLETTYVRRVQAILREFPPVEGLGESDLQEALEHFEKALSHQPDHYAAAAELLVLLLDEGRIADYLSVARDLVSALPDKGEAHLLLGLSLHHAGREEEAAAAFEQGLAALSPERRRELESLEQVLPPDQAEQYTKLGEDARLLFHERYWRFRDPLYLTEVNEQRLEYLARKVYVDVRFREPRRRGRVWENDRRVVWLRYGRPEDVGTVGGSTLWDYGDFAGEEGVLAREYRAIRPNSYHNIPAIPKLYAIPSQIARFRADEPGWVATELHVAIPIDSLLGDTHLRSSVISTGLFLLNPEGQAILREVKSITVSRDGPVGSGLRSWRLVLPPGGPLLVGIEARHQVTWRTAAARDTFTATAFPEDLLSLSDLLLADQLRRLSPAPSRRSELDIAANVGLRYSVGQPVHMYYEIYGLQRGESDVASYNVAISVKVTRLHREGLIASFLGPLADAWGFSIVGDDRLELRYHREVEMIGLDRALEFLSLDLLDAPPGEYEIRVQVWDRLSEQLASRSRRFTVAEEE